MKHATKILILLSTGFLAQSTFISAARADCVTDCMTRLGCFSGGMGNQNCGFDNSHGLEMCNIQCKGQVVNAFGAIAYSTTEKISGWSYNLADKATAEKTALQYCAKSGGSKCSIEASFHNICGAIATTGDSVYWGTDGTKYNAEQRALAQCGGAAKKCSVQASVCSSPSAAGGSSLPTAPPPPKAVSWGAIAYSSADMGAGWSQGQVDRASAEKQALAICAQRGKACTVRTAFNKECAALAADRNFTGWGASPDQRAAQQTAVDDCKKAGGTRCVLHISFCSM